ncbi:hypothetical protein H9P43_000620 [Blastocladiella emersonii ATCC 22665]|nr:hypothetical protein H9P43_000620 [Blastocladiella emersonii ATCC 22665]
MAQQQHMQQTPEIRFALNPAKEGQEPVFITAPVASDAEHLKEILNRDLTIHQAAFRVPYPYGDAEAAAYLAHAAAPEGRGESLIRVGSATAPPVGRFAVTERQLNQGLPADPVGGIPQADLLEWTIGYWLDSRVRGQGIVTRAIRASQAKAETDPRVVRVFIYCYTDNAASCAAVERCGFELEGTMRRGTVAGGRPRDLFVLSWIPSRYQ